MNLVVSTIGTDSGLLWEQNLNASLTIIDGHNHTSGSGVPIPPSGININSDLTFGGNQATNLKAVLFTNQTSLATVNALYVVAGDLYYNDPTGAVQITLAGAVNATTSGISSGTASAAFSSGVLVVNSAANTPANIQVGSVLLGNNSAGSHFLTLAPPAAMAADFTLTLPSIPASQKIMTLDASGNIAAPYTVDNSTIAISSNQLIVKALGIGTPQLADDSVTPAKLDDSGSFTMASISATNAVFGNVAASTTLRYAGQNAVISNTNASNNLAVIRGYVQANAGGIYAGEGFSVSAASIGSGLVGVTYTTAFDSYPAVSVEVVSNGTLYFAIVKNDNTASACNIQFFDSTGTPLAGSTPEFHIHVIGKRA